MEVDGDASGLHPRHGDPVDAAMWGPLGRGGGPGDSCKQPVELVLHEGWASRGVSSFPKPSQQLGVPTPTRALLSRQGKWEEEQPKQPPPAVTFKPPSLLLCCGYTRPGGNTFPSLARRCSHSSGYRELGTASGKHAEMLILGGQQGRGEAGLTVGACPVTAVGSGSPGPKELRDAQRGAEGTVGLGGMLAARTAEERSCQPAVRGRDSCLFLPCCFSPASWSLHGLVFLLSRQEGRKGELQMGRWHRGLKCVKCARVLTYGHERDEASVQPQQGFIAHPPTRQPSKAAGGSGVVLSSAGPWVHSAQLLA